MQCKHNRNGYMKELEGSRIEVGDLEISCS